MDIKYIKYIYLKRIILLMYKTNFSIKSHIYLEKIYKYIKIEKVKGFRGKNIIRQGRFSLVDWVV